MTSVSSSEIAADHSAVSATTPKAGGAEETPARGRQISVETEISTLASAISELADAVRELQSQIEHNTAAAIDDLTDEIRTLSTNVKIFRPS